MTDLFLSGSLQVTSARDDVRLCTYENEANNYYVNENSHFKYAGQPILLYIKQQKEKYDLNREASRRVSTKLK